MDWAESWLPVCSKLALKCFVPAITIDVIWSYKLSARTFCFPRSRTCLAQVVLARECRTLFTLHQSSGGVVIHIIRSSNANISGALLHDDAEDYPLFDAKLSCLEDCIPNATHIFPAISCLEHLGFVCVEDGCKILPRAHGRKWWSGTGVPSETHLNRRKTNYLVIILESL